jgi:HAD superfamily hydrolase (TIGR01509 family)
MSTSASISVGKRPDDNIVNPCCASSARPPRAVVFDMDGVIVDSHPLHRIAWREFLRALGKPVDESALDFVLDGRTRKEILLHFLGPLTPDQLEDYGCRKDELFRQFDGEVHAIPGVLEFLHDLSQRGVPMALATSATGRRVQGTLKQLGLAQFFRGIVTGDEVGAGKPDPAIYRLAAERLHQPASSLLAIEDAVSGVKSARAAGLRCMGVASAPRAEVLRAAGADPVFPDFRGLTFGQVVLALDRATT